MFKLNDIVIFVNPIDGVTTSARVTIDQTDIYLYVESGFSPLFKHHVIDTTSVKVAFDIGNFIWFSKFFNARAVLKIDKLTPCGSPTFVKNVKAMTEGPSAKVVGGNCSKCGIFNEYQAGPYICWCCK
jgi:hypothetical protein